MEVAKLSELDWNPPKPLKLVVHNHNTCFLYQTGETNVVLLPKGKDLTEGEKGMKQKEGEFRCKS